MLDLRLHSDSTQPLLCATVCHFNPTLCPPAQETRSMQTQGPRGSVAHFRFTKLLCGFTVFQCYLTVLHCRESTPLWRQHAPLCCHSAPLWCQNAPLWCHSALLWCHSAPLLSHSAPVWCHSAQCGVKVLHFCFTDSTVETAFSIVLSQCTTVMT